ncbi:MAG: hypothetical protein C5B47_01415 [Verrucomicrobia bacterium]|nr:MAG: hypothetical protein C5B47_01415 [Verrucomicrobiota bacterium]
MLQAIRIDRNLVAHCKTSLKKLNKANDKEPSDEIFVKGHLALQSGSSPRGTYSCQFGLTFGTPEAKKKMRCKFAMPCRLSRTDKTLIRCSFEKGYQTEFPAAYRIRRSPMEKVRSFFKFKTRSFFRNNLHWQSPKRRVSPQEYGINFSEIEHYNKAQEEIRKLREYGATRPDLTELRVQAFQHGCLAAHINGTVV